ncbi:MAG: hypothetical protein JXB14_04175 [Candidatus Altiarchaeota archaeon]|nr:hypothetical protein [Candidatus Altiarchaeota archaeon]
MDRKKTAVMCCLAFMAVVWSFLSFRYFQRGDVEGGFIFLIIVVAVLILTFASSKGYLKK